jgi:hypothetical protein
MNKLVTLESKKQPTILLFILQFNFNKLEASLSCARPQSPLENQFTLGNVVIYPNWLEVVLCQMSIIVTIETLELGQISFHLLD